MERHYGEGRSVFERMMEHMTKNFDRIAATYDATRGGESRGRAVAKDLAPLLRPGPVLEIGIGTGIVALGLKELGRSVSGVDIGFEMATRATQRIGPRVVQGDAEDLPIRTNSIANACSVMFLHLVDVGAVMREVARILIPGGRYVVQHGHDRQTTPVEAIEAEMFGALQPKSQSSTRGRILEFADAVGMRLVEQTLGAPQRYGITPSKEAARIEQRSASALWDVDAETWARVVAPAIERIRALPDPETRLLGVARARFFVFEA